jgi:hypothetical protein
MFRNNLTPKGRNLTASFKDLVRTAQKALFIWVVKTSQSVFYIAKAAAWAEIH